MVVPDRFPGQRAAAVLWFILALGWMALEGNLTADIILAVTGLALLLAWALSRALGGRRFSLPGWLGMSALAGLLWGMGTVVGVMFLMSVKTGLHSHGPEYTPAEIAWVWGQLPLWMVGGALAGLGIGLLAAARWSGRPPAGTDRGN